jgi:hypothetical protein
VGIGKKHHEIQKGNYRVEGRLIKLKQKGASGDIQTNDDRHVIEKTPSPQYPFCGVSPTTKHKLWECTDTTKERERERKREREREEKPEQRKRYGQMEQED